MIRKFILWTIVIISILSSGIFVLYFYILYNNSSFLFSYHSAYKNVRINTNERVIIDTLLNRSLIKLNRSGLFCDESNFDIYFCDSYGLFTFLAPANSGSFGVHRSLSNIIILSRTDFQKGLIVRKGESNPIRTIESVITHEMTHQLIESKFGFWKTRFMPEWKKEGFCEYVAGASSFDVREGMRLFAANQNDPSASYRYFKYRLYVTYLIRNKGLTFHQIVSRSIDTEELENEIRDQVRSNTFSLGN